MPLKNIAYLINQYPMASQTFIRREIAAMEANDAPVQRYAIRGWDTPLVDEADRVEAEKTRRILDGGSGQLLTATLKFVFRRPRRFVRAMAAALRLGRKSERGVLIHLVYLAEACVLCGWMQRDRIDHLHVHFGTNSTAVAMLCRLLGGPPYSFTVHGPEEFDQPLTLSLPEKIRHAAFVVCICSYGRSQLWRWADFVDWAKVHVVHCGLDQSYLATVPSPPASNARLINIGRLSEQKGQLILVEAASLSAQAGRRLDEKIGRAACRERV